MNPGSEYKLWTDADLEELARSKSPEAGRRKIKGVFHGNFMEEMWDHEGTCKKIGGQS
jgi:hypothetical protein